ncbi:MAG: hypothetical protein EB082_08350 [Verrucomicrobia bacterium]|nr:hypothetical protein [Verrucomicrobiota bacterium]
MPPQRKNQPLMQAMAERNRGMNRRHGMGVALVRSIARFISNSPLTRQSCDAISASNRTVLKV